MATTGRLTGAIPCLGVRDLRVASAHYRRLGFEMTPTGDVASVGRRDGVALMIFERGDRSIAPPAESTIWLSVDNVAALRSEWDQDKVGGQMLDSKADDTEVFVHVDPDGNRLQVSAISVPPVEQ